MDGRCCPLVLSAFDPLAASFSPSRCCPTSLVALPLLPPMPALYCAVGEPSLPLPPSLPPLTLLRPPCPYATGGDDSGLQRAARLPLFVLSPSLCDLHG